MGRGPVYLHSEEADSAAEQDLDALGFDRKELSMPMGRKKDHQAQCDPNTLEQR